MAPVPTPTATQDAPAVTQGSTPEATRPGSPTPAPTLAATDPPLGAAWEAATGLGDADIFDIARGPLGWVAAGTTCDDCDAAAWFSADGLAWSGGAIPNDGTGTSWVSSVAAHGSAWVAAGGRLEDDGGSAAVSRALIWRSEDGRKWSLADSILLGRCLEGCPLIGAVVAGSSCVILSGVQTIDPDRSSVYWSRDGDDWAQVDRAVFKQRPGVGTYVFPTAPTVLDDGRFVLVAQLCGGCGMVWSSMDGLDWSQGPTLTPDPLRLDVATDGRRVVVVEQACDDCLTTTWTSADGRTGWQRGPTELPILSAHVTYAADRFVVAGKRLPNGVSIFTSPDGAAWTRIDSDLAIGDCGVADLAGSDDRIIVAADDHCSPAIWVSRAP
ncbi:MAG: hypothetical protein ACR2H0_04210 [Candidatus Limnocylindrales bacterium]